MAFLCPVRIRRGKKKKSSSGHVEAAQSPSSTFSGLGRITGSSSIETLVRVALEKENGLSFDSKMVLLHDFTPCVDDELLVKKGQIVNILYRENDWVYVVSEDSRLEGFIPLSYCTPHNSHLGELALHNFKKKLPRDQSSNTCINVDIHKTYTSDSEKSIKKELNQNQLQHHGSPNNSVGSTSQADMNHFLKDPSGRFIVLYSFVARDENDVSVERGDFVTVLNRDDPDWYWIVRSDGHEGFVPSGFVYPADVLQKMTSNMASTSNNTTSATNSSSNAITNKVLANPTLSNFHEEVRFHGTELVMLYDYKAQASDDLSIRRGDWIYADLNNQKVDGWLWVYAPKTKKYGFVPKVYARPSAMTIQRHTKK